MVVHVCNPSTREKEAGRLDIQGQPLLYSEILSSLECVKRSKIKINKKKIWNSFVCVGDKS